mmetsp:Transcript_119378/g.166571  ORF Transcript_119378/g.166571 Transcript_119378/m.166571 type:complete len:144 (+) Transcript_119378:67-498(+)
MKVIKRNKIVKDNQGAIKELEILKKLNHPNVVKLYEIIDDPSQNKICLIMDYLSGGDLQGLVKKNVNGIDQEEVRQYARALLSAIYYCHNETNIIHRDIKPENVMLDSEGRAVLVDFGVSHLFDGQDDNVKDTVGSYRYFAPE